MAACATSTSPFAGLLHCPTSASSATPRAARPVSPDQASTRPIAGTRPRGAGAREDQHLHAELLASPKERAEHVMLVDLERNDLGKVCRYGTVQVNEFMTVEQYSHVRHLVSDVTGILKAGTSPLTSSGPCFPAAPSLAFQAALHGSHRRVGTGAARNLHGSPRILLLERRPRPEYSDSNPALTKTHGYLQVGAGIVADSDPDREYEETLAKAGAFFNILEAGR